MYNEDRGFNPICSDKQQKVMTDRELIEDLLWMLEQESRSKYDIYYIGKSIKLILKNTDYFHGIIGSKKL